MIRRRYAPIAREAIRHGSLLSFHAASRLLPARVRDPALALYAFCRLADDAVDLVGRREAGGVSKPVVNGWMPCLCRAPRGCRCPTAPLPQLSSEFDMPRALPEALLEGLAWDADGAQAYADACPTCAIIPPAWPRPWGR